MIQACLDKAVSLLNRKVYFLCFLKVLSYLSLILKLNYSINNGKYQFSFHTVILTLPRTFTICDAELIFH